MQVLSSILTDSSHLPRHRPPEPDRAYLQTIEVIEYDIECIQKGLMLGTDDPDPNGFRAVVRIAEHLFQVIRLAAIAQERKGVS